MSARDQSELDLFVVPPPSCPKCYGEEWTDSWKASGCEAPSCPGYVKEHLHRKCTECGYWRAAWPADASGVQQ